MQKKFFSILQQYTWVGMILISILPIFFLPYIQDYYDSAKWYGLMAITVCSLFFWTLELAWSKKTTHIEFSPFVTGLFALFFASTLSVVFSSSNKIEALLHPFGPITFISLALFSLTFSTFSRIHARHHMRFLLYVSTSLLALIAIYQWIGIGKSMFPTLTYLADKLWTPTGSSAATLAIFILIVPILLSDATIHLKDKKETHAAILIMMLLLVISGAFVTAWQFVPQIKNTMLPFTIGWSITLEILKNMKLALLGIGAENFLSAFNIGKPPSYNMSSLWSIRFTTSSNFLFHITTVYGLAGFAACMFLCKSLLPKRIPTKETLSLVLSFIALMVVPPSLGLLYTITLIYLISPHDSRKEITLPTVSALWARMLITVILIFGIGASGYALYRSFAAEYVFYSSLVSAKENNGTQTYNLQIKSIGLNQYISKYHLIYSQTNLALAISLANAINQPDNKGSAEQKIKDQELVAQLIQQSIREAKIATTLNAKSVLAWENLARIYNQLIGMAQGADTWTAASYAKAIELDPYNPILRLELGAVAMKQKNYTEAITQFQRSASLKQNYANAYYNLAYAYKASGDGANALSALKMTQSLLEKTSPDHEKISKDIETLTTP